MKKSLLALAVLGAFAGVASAQSSVTLFGTVDLNGRYVKNTGGDRTLSMSKDGINSSEFGVKGVEDLGGGLKAGFELKGALNADTGTADSRFWGRRAVVKLMGNFGEVRLGRDYTPTFWNNTIFDAFGTNGLGDSSHVQQMTGAGFTNTFVRADNSIGYFLPSGIGGVYGQFMAAASEKAATNTGRYVGGRVGFAAGPFDVAVAYAAQRLDALPSAPSQKTINIGGSYDLSVVKLMGYYDRDTLSYTGVDKKESRGSFSAVVPFGQSEIHAGYSLSKLDSLGVTTKIDQFALGYVYNLSKRTAMYSTVSRLNNKNGTKVLLGGTSPDASPKSTGAEFGIRHFF